MDETNKYRVTALPYKNSLVASLGRLERPTHCLEGSCSIRLSYRDTNLVPLAGVSALPPPVLSDTRSL